MRAIRDQGEGFHLIQAACDTREGIPMTARPDEVVAWPSFGNTVWLSFRTPSDVKPEVVPEGFKPVNNQWWSDAIAYTPLFEMERWRGMSESWKVCAEAADSRADRKEAALQSANARLAAVLAALDSEQAEAKRLRDLAYELRANGDATEADFGRADRLDIQAGGMRETVDAIRRAAAGEGDANNQPKEDLKMKVIVPDYVNADDANRLYGEGYGVDWEYEGKMK
jgi:hypothetical protein